MKTVEAFSLSSDRHAAKPTPQSAPAHRPVTPDALGISSLKMSAKERLAMLEQLAMLLDSGIQIPAALQSMNTECDSRRTAAVLQRLEQSVVIGRPLSDAIAEMPRAFPKIVCQMTRAGERAGVLPSLLQRAVEMLEADLTMVGKLRSAMVYPAAMLTLTIGVVVFLLTSIVPRFERLFRSRNSTLPAPTRCLMAIGDFMQHYGLLLLGGLIAVAIGTFLFARTRRGARFFDGVALRLPLLGAVYRASILARGARTIGLLVRSGVPAHVALEHARDVSSSPIFADFWSDARTQVVNGKSLTEAIRGSRLVPPTFKQVISAGESTARLDETMLKTADRYTREVDRRVRDLLALLEPAMVVFTGGIVGFIALSIMLPIFRMSRG